VILLMGIAGSGKGTQGTMLAEKLGLEVVSMGEAIRSYANEAQRQKMLAGELLEDQDVISIIDKVLNATTEKDLILDGFPRTIPQAEWLLAQAKSNRFKLDLAIHLTASKQAVKDRLVKRGRIDDTDEVIDARFKEYEKSTKPLIDWLDDNGIKVVNVNAERPVEEINQELVSLLEADN
jgi:adenylate kinase